MFKDPRVIVPELGKFSSIGEGFGLLRRVPNEPITFSNEGGETFSRHLIIKAQGFGVQGMLKSLESAALGLFASHFNFGILTIELRVE